nr:MAG TPA: hypothetical protein [Caudoviricetes sp.]
MRFTPKQTIFLAGGQCDTVYCRLVPGQIWKAEIYYDKFHLYRGNITLSLSPERLCELFEEVKHPWLKCIFTRL